MSTVEIYRPTWERTEGTVVTEYQIVPTREGPDTALPLGNCIVSLILSFPFIIPGVVIPVARQLSGRQVLKVGTEHTNAGAAAAATSGRFILTFDPIRLASMRRRLVFFFVKSCFLSRPHNPQATPSLTLSCLASDCDCDCVS